MTSLSQAKTLGGIGSILVILSIIPAVGGLIAVVGLVLILVAVKNISDVLGDRTIFNNMLLSTVMGIVGILVGVFVFFATFFSAIVGGGFVPGPGGPFPGGRFFEPFASLLAGLAIIWIFFVVSAVFLRRSYSSIAKALNVEMFATAALLYPVGAILVVIAVGFIIIFIATILQAVAFFSIPEQLRSRLEQPSPSWQPPQS